MRSLLGPSLWPLSSLRNECIKSHRTYFIISTAPSTHCSQKAIEDTHTQIRIDQHLYLKWKQIYNVNVNDFTGMTHLI